MPSPMPYGRRITTTGIAATATLGLLIHGAGGAAADVVADKTRSVQTEGGKTLTVTKAAETLDRHPNLAATPFTREGFVSLRAIAEIGGESEEPVDSASVTFGYYVGCQVDLADGMTVGVGVSAGPSVSVDVFPEPSVNLGLNASVSPSVSVDVKPGSIKIVEFGKKSFTGPRASITADQVEIKVDACAGPVTLRSFATASLSTPSEDHSTTVYGDPIPL
ncbi:MspA family porin [Nocardia sp. CDC159]|uniref:MspA family porin n=1 Tax=Nocardia pulmonis TaxID=2951408 RepID=A0A9X2E0V3_9NOCA|nr:MULTISPECIES: MspA family porin [Nocardia]MCM6771947.1 MspA family porin [Nocardia pulmonis]MCM6785395.1 MspA family porin [Nocardia sp. CDC159]